MIRHWAPWLDSVHPRPAVPGELRWFTTAADGEDIEVEGRGPHPVNGEPILARSRTYIPARLADNPDLSRTGYAAVLAGLPEELRRAYRDGNFAAGLKDHDFQVIPTAWIEAAQRRWRPDGWRGVAMTAIGLDVAQGGADFTVLAARHGGWYAPLVRKPGHETRDGSAVAAAVVAVRRDRCPVVVDVDGGWGGDTVARLKDNGNAVVGFSGRQHVVGADAGRPAEIFQQTGRSVVADARGPRPRPARRLHPGAAARRFHQGRPRGAALGSLRPAASNSRRRPKFRKRLGRSPDYGDAIVMGLSEGARAAASECGAARRASGPSAPMWGIHI